MNDRQTAKATVLRYFESLEAASPDGIVDALSANVDSGYRFRGVHPFNELGNVNDVASNVWRPLKQSFTALQRRQDIFMAGPNRIDGQMWVTSMGCFMGLFDRDWLGIPSTGKIALLPYCEFHRLAADGIAESALWVDIISLMKQAGLNPLPPQTGAEMINPGPRTADGLLFDAQPERESQQTMDLIMAMCDDVVGDWNTSGSASLKRTWHDNMAWYGPSGIGATYTIDRYREQHQQPFRSGLGKIDFNGHVMEHAEGYYGGWFGWPNFHTTQGEGFLGLPASDRQASMRVVDIYRRDGDKLAENWVFIDLLHYLNQLGVDVLERCRVIARR